MKPLGLYSDRSLIPKGIAHAIILNPFWGKDAVYPELYPGSLDDYKRRGRSWFRLVPLDEADVAVLPFRWEEVDRHPELREKAEGFIRRCRQAGKPVLVFYISDNSEPLNLDGALIFRNCLYRSMSPPNELPMPTWAEDFARTCVHGEDWPRPKGEKPVVGFCGHAEHPDPPLLLRAKKMASRFAQSVGLVKKRTNPWIELRGRALKILSACPELVGRFLVRERHFGGAVRERTAVDLKRLRQVRQEFVANMLEADYVLCIRGGGNSSHRFYEVLSAGKIPVFVNTDSILPFERWIPWRKHLVWVEEEELDQIAEKVLEFHRRIDKEAYVDLQRRNRHLWEEWLSPSGFFRHLHLCLPTLPSSVRNAARTGGIGA